MPTFKKAHISKLEDIKKIRPAMWHVFRQSAPQAFSSIGISDETEWSGEWSDDTWKELLQALRGFEVTQELGEFVNVLVDLELIISLQDVELAMLLESADSPQKDKVEDQFNAKYKEAEALSCVELALLLLLSPETKQAFIELIRIQEANKGSVLIYRRKSQKDDYSRIPSDEQIKTIKSHLQAGIYIGREKIRPRYCEVYMLHIKSKDDEELLFHVEYSARPAIAAEAKEDAKVEPLVTHPITSQFYIFNKVNKTIRTNETSKARREHFIDLLSAILGGEKASGFILSDSFDFSKLEEAGWNDMLNGQDVENLVRVRLREVHCNIADGDKPYIQVYKVHTRRCLTTALENIESSPYETGFQGVIRAHFELMFQGESNRLVLIKLIDKQRILISRKNHEADGMLWLRNAGFLTQQPDIDIDDE